MAWEYFYGLIGETYVYVYLNIVNSFAVIFAFIYGKWEG